MSLVGFLGATMLWVKAAHIIFVIFLMAGLFMMPRFFVYHGFKQRQRLPFAHLAFFFLFSLHRHLLVFIRRFF